jgi:hypothetical protein
MPMIETHVTPVIEAHVSVLRAFGNVVVRSLEEADAVGEAFASDPLGKFLSIEPELGADDERYVLRVSLSVTDAAKLRGIVIFDTALPQDWVDEVRRATGICPVGHVVWRYDLPSPPGVTFPARSIAGYPAAVTPQGDSTLSLWASAVLASTRPCRGDQ